MALPALFNPSNDMALAANVKHYTPPPRIQQMEADLADLALLWREGPWGWSLATKERYRRMGYADLPSDEWLGELRALSSREWACRYINMLLEATQGPYVGHEMRFVSCVEPTEEPLVVKTPWSSSGRGVRFYPEGLRMPIESAEGLCVDRFYADKLHDFAMEFDVEEHDVRYLGLSLFLTDARGAYRGNLLASQQELRRIIGMPEGVEQELASAFASLAPLGSYRGPLGIDMMMLADGRIHPCVEVNFRRTMGHLALTLAQRGQTHDHNLTPVRPTGFRAYVSHHELRVGYVS